MCFGRCARVRLPDRTELAEKFKKLFGGNVVAKER